MTSPETDPPDGHIEVDGEAMAYWLPPRSLAEQSRARVGRTLARSTTPRAERAVAGGVASERLVLSPRQEGKP